MPLSRTNAPPRVNVPLPKLDIDLRSPILVVDISNLSCSLHLRKYSPPNLTMCIATGKLSSIPVHSNVFVTSTPPPTFPARTKQIRKPEAHSAANPNLDSLTSVMARPRRHCPKNLQRNQPDQASTADYDWVAGHHARIGRACQHHAQRLLGSNLTIADSWRTDVGASQSVTW
jgi:hypothetical protein